MCILSFSWLPAQSTVRFLNRSLCSTVCRAMEGHPALDTIHDDALLAIVTWLSGDDLARLAQTCRKVRGSAIRPYTMSVFS